MKPADSIRGSALPETAIILTATLALIFGVIQIGMIGYLQIQCDGAAFIAAHEYSLGNASYAQVAARPFPLMGTPLATPNPPDVASSAIPVTYSQLPTAREGGVSILMPNHWQATVNIVSSLGSWITNLHGSAIEPNYLVSNPAYDNADAGYAGNPAPAGATFFGSTEDTPDYYVSSHRILICRAPWLPSWSICPNPSVNLSLRSLGTAEFLDVDNWARTTSGVGPGTSYTFAEIFCHVNAYVLAASDFPPNVTSAGSMPKGGVTSKTSMIYGWDNWYGNESVSYNDGGSSVETPGQYPLSPDAGC
jgi:hypothetical protein